MIRKHKKHPRGIVSIPIGFYAGAAFMLVTSLLVSPGLLKTGDSTSKEWLPLLMIVGLTIAFVAAALLYTKTLRVEGEQLLVKTVFGENRHSLAEAKLSYIYTGTTSHPRYMLVLKRIHENPVRLVSLGMGMDMLREIRKAHWIAGVLEVPLEIPHNLQQAAEIQGRSSFISLRLLPIIFIGIVLLGGGVTIVVKLFTGPPEIASIHFRCMDMNFFEVNNIHYEQKGNFSVQVKPGIHTVRWKKDGTWRVYRIPLEKREEFIFQCDSPPQNYRLNQEDPSSASHQ